MSVGEGAMGKGILRDWQRPGPGRGWEGGDGNGEGDTGKGAMGNGRQGGNKGAKAMRRRRGGRRGDFTGGYNGYRVD